MKLTLSIILFLLYSSIGFAGTPKSEAYKGTVSNVKMNDKHFADIQNQVFTLTKKSETSAIISGQMSKIGKMPGTLCFSIPVTIKQDGTLVTDEGIDIGKLKLPLGASKNLICKELKGKIKSNNLHFSLRVISKMLGITVADASFSFESK